VVLSSNGSGKSALLRLLAAEPVAHSGLWRLGARISPGLFAQTHDRPDLAERTPAEVLMTEHALLRNEAMAALARYELQLCASQPFGTLSGGQQARLQILLLELAGSTLLLLDEPTDNLDLASAEALQSGLESYEGVVLAVTHDRWFARSFDRFLVFGSSGDVYEASEPIWDEARTVRPR
jgi:ATPase subunit of ABC transporter with duplicated ATPase domains